MSRLALLVITLGMTIACNDVTSESTETTENATVEQTDGKTFFVWLESTPEVIPLNEPFAIKVSITMAESAALTDGGMHDHGSDALDGSHSDGHGDHSNHEGHGEPLGSSQAMAMSSAYHVKIDANMPEHGHGMNTAPDLAAGEDPAVFLAEQVLFHMPGLWQLEIEVSKDGEHFEKATFEYELKSVSE